jgi:hypothetical protein
LEILGERIDSHPPMARRMSTYLACWIIMLTCLIGTLDASPHRAHRCKGNALGSSVTNDLLADQGSDSDDSPAAPLEAALLSRKGHSIWTTWN